MHFPTALLVSIVLASGAMAQAVYKVTNFYATHAAGPSKFAYVSFDIALTEGGQSTNETLCFGTIKTDNYERLGNFHYYPCTGNMYQYFSLVKSKKTGQWTFNFTEIDNGGSYTFPKGAESTYVVQEPLSTKNETLRQLTAPGGSFQFVDVY